jgi:hypothetical protein
MLSFITVLYGSQALFSLYNLSLCIISITNLRGYEATSKKAAQYSQAAADELNKTRTTQASALLAVGSPLLKSRINTNTDFRFSSPYYLQEFWYSAKTKHGGRK